MLDETKSGVSQTQAENLRLAREERRRHAWDSDYMTGGKRDQMAEDEDEFERMEQMTRNDAILGKDMERCGAAIWKRR